MKVRWSKNCKACHPNHTEGGEGMTQHKSGELEHFKRRKKKKGGRRMNRERLRGNILKSAGFCGGKEKKKKLSPPCRKEERGGGADAPGFIPMMAKRNDRFLSFEACDKKVLYPASKRKGERGEDLRIASSIYFEIKC